MSFRLVSFTFTTFLFDEIYHDNENKALVCLAKCLDERYISAALRLLNGCRLLRQRGAQLPRFQGDSGAQIRMEPI